MSLQFGAPTVVKNIVYGKEGREKLIEGVDKLANAVKSTLGAGGNTVILENDFGQPHITKDGVTVANHVVLEDAVENLAVNIVRQAARQTASKAGDGTTTATLLSQAIIHSYIANDGDEHSFRKVKQGINSYADKALSILSKKSVKITDDRLDDVSIISCNNDKDLGLFISSAFKEAGDNGIVTMQKNEEGETYVETREGTHISSTLKSHHFYTNREKEVCELNKPLVFLSASEIPNVKQIQTILEYAIKSNRSILLVASCDNQVVSALAMNNVRGNIKCAIIEPDSFGLKKKDLLDDIALLTGAKALDESLGDAIDLVTPEVLGEVDKAIIDNEGTTLVIDNLNEEVQERVDDIRKTLDSEDHHILRPHLEKRLAVLTGGVSIIHVGGNTEVELSEKVDRVDDAIHAVKAAKKEGILPGGGAALHWIATNHDTDCIGGKILREAIFSPFNVILTNAGLNPMDKDYNIKKWGIGVDVIDGKVKDMRKAGIIDPTLVTKEALKNAVSVATTILETNAVVSNIRES